MEEASPLRTTWRKYVPSRLRVTLERVRAARRDAAWRKPRDLGELRRTTPFSTWGSSRGGPIDRVYIEQFMQQHANDIQGRALEAMQKVRSKLDHDLFEFQMKEIPRSQKVDSLAQVEQRRTR